MLYCRYFPLIYSLRISLVSAWVESPQLSKVALTTLLNASPTFSNRPPPRLSLHVIADNNFGRQLQDLGVWSIQKSHHPLPQPHKPPGPARWLDYPQGCPSTSPRVLTSRLVSHYSHNWTGNPSTERTLHEPSALGSLSTVHLEDPPSSPTSTPPKPCWHSPWCWVGTWGVVDTKPVAVWRVHAGEALPRVLYRPPPRIKLHNVLSSKMVTTTLREILGGGW
jgi:hypothetical protein